MIEQISWSLALSILSLLFSGAALFLAGRAARRVEEPVQLRGMVLQYDQTLTEHEQKLNAYYARLRKALKASEGFERTPESDSDDGTGEGEGSPQGDDKLALWGRARDVIAARGGR